MMRAVASIVPLVLAAAVAAAPSTKITICTAEQCLASTSNISVGAVVSMDSKSANYIILPGTYDPASSPSKLGNALSGGASRIAMSPGFELSGIPPVLSLQPGIVATSASLYRGPVRFEAAREPGQLLGDATVSAQGSVLMAQNVWATFRRTQDDSHIVVWDSIPDMSQLPESLKGSDMNPIDIQSTGCAAICSANGVCTPDGACKCAPGFEGDSCETCKPGFYGSKCAACPEGCAKCSDGLAGTGVCLEPVKPNPSVCSCLNGLCNADGTCACFDGWRDDPNGSLFKCSSCDDGFYLTPSTGECKACGVGCSSCAMSSGVCMRCEESFISDASDVTRCRRREFNTDGRIQNCPPGRYVLNGLCQEALPNGACNENSTRIANVATGGCEPCPSGCVTCEVDNFAGNTFSKTQCTTCLPGKVLVDGTCEDRCPSGRFISPQDGFSCLPCDSSCSECFGDATTCYKCPNDQLANNGSCVSSCPEGSVPNNGFCSPCHGDCATCTGTEFDKCTSCRADRPVLQGTGTGAFAVGRCLPTCAHDEFFDNGSGKCQTCHASCSSCSGPGANNCLACSSPRQTLAAGSCVDAACTGALSVVQGMGVCLSTLVEAPYVPNDPALSPSSDSSTSIAEAATINLSWWQILLMVLGGVFLLCLCLVLWRLRMRKRRAAETAAFATQINTRSMFWRGAFWLSERLFGHRGRDDAVPVVAPHMQQQHTRSSQGGMLIDQHLRGSSPIQQLSSESVGTRGGPESADNNLWQTSAHTGVSSQSPPVTSHLTGTGSVNSWTVSDHPTITTKTTNNPFRH